MKSKVREYRRELHRIPELGFELYKTKAYILEQLHPYDCEIIEVCEIGVCAFFSSRDNNGKGNQRRHTVALRCDMDALPVSEETDASYRSIHKGVMHACGHDGHMAMLLSVAGELNQSIHTLSHNVLLIFQPGEETTGAAEELCKTGIFEKYGVRRIYGFHLWPMLEKNAIGSRAEEFMAKSSEFDLIIEGKSVHCANEREGIDALEIGCRLVSELYKMEKQELPEEEFRLLKFGRMESGTVRNVISGRTVLEGSVRCFHEETGDFLFRRIHEIAASYEKKYGCRITIERSDGYPAVMNDPALFEEAKKLLFDHPFHTFQKPFMQAEDFSCYQKVVPGLFLFLGTGTGIPLHSCNFDFDEEVLETGVDIFLKLLRGVHL